MTDWELGNELLCHVMDEMKQTAMNAKEQRPSLARLLDRQWQELRDHYVELVGDKKVLV